MPKNVKAGVVVPVADFGGAFAMGGGSNSDSAVGELDDEFDMSVSFDTDVARLGDGGIVGDADVLVEFGVGGEIIILTVAGVGAANTATREIGVNAGIAHNGGDESVAAGTDIDVLVAVIAEADGLEGLAVGRSGVGEAVAGFGPSEFESGGVDVVITGFANAVTAAESSVFGISAKGETGRTRIVNAVTHETTGPERTHLGAGGVATSVVAVHDIIGAFPVLGFLLGEAEAESLLNINTGGAVVFEEGAFDAVVGGEIVFGGEDVGGEVSLLAELLVGENFAGLEKGGMLVFDRVELINTFAGGTVALVGVGARETTFHAMNDSEKLPSDTVFSGGFFVERLVGLNKSHFPVGPDLDAGVIEIVAGADTATT